MMLRTFALIAVTAGLSACGQSPQTPPVKAPDPVPAPAPAPPPPAAKPGATPWSAGPITATTKGVGPITGDTAFNPEALTALFPLSKVKAAFLHGEGNPIPIINIDGPEKLVLELQPDTSGGRVAVILAQGGPVEGPKGEKLLDKWTALGFTRDQCVMGLDRFVGALLCRRPEAPDLAYVFALPGNKGADDVIPEEAWLARKAFLREFLWQAPLGS